MIYFLTLFRKILLIIPTVSLISCNTSLKNETPTTSGSTNEDFEVIAYYMASTGKIEKETAQQLDQIIFSFLHLNGNKFHVDDAKDSAAIEYLVSLKEDNPDLEVLLSLGGWGGCETCSEIFSTEAGRSEFAQSVKNVLENFNADGIDLDWEYPVVEGYPGHPYKPADRENFTFLVEELRNTLGKDYRITFAAGGFNDYLEKAVEWKKIMPLLDGVNLMSYDLVNGNSIVTGHHTPLYSTAEQQVSTYNAFRFLDSLGIPRKKIIIGAAFYARVWENVNHTSNGIYQQGKFLKSVPFKELETFFNKNAGFTYFWDSIAHAPYSYNANKEWFATYDDSLSIAHKTEFVIEKNLGGIMFWQLSGDKDENGLLDVIHRVKNQHHM